MGKLMGFTPQFVSETELGKRIIKRANLERFIRAYRLPRRAAIAAWLKERCCRDRVLWASARPVDLHAALPPPTDRAWAGDTSSAACYTPVKSDDAGRWDAAPAEPKEGDGTASTSQATGPAVAACATGAHRSPKGSVPQPGAALSDSPKKS